jgi:ABC-type Zn2+ transport system substrate-binding protein/surface adhesin
MKVLDEESFDFVSIKKTVSADLIKEIEETFSSKSHCEEIIEINTQKKKKSTAITDINELEDLSNDKKHKKTIISHELNNCHSDEDQNCETNFNMHEDKHSHSCDSHEQEEHNHSHSHEGIFYI